MIYYPTTLLPPSPLYSDVDSVITALCDNCLRQHYDFTISESEKTQLFEITLVLVGFWEEEKLDQ